MPSQINDSKPTNQDVARRVLILKRIIVHGMTAPPRPMLEKLRANWPAAEAEKFAHFAEAQRDAMCKSLVSSGLWEHLSPSETELAKTNAVTMTERQHICISWRMEAAQVLMWAFGMLEKLPPYDTMADVKILKTLPITATQLLESAPLREQDEIDQARDIAELWHWRSRTRELIERGEPFRSNKKMKAAGFNSYDDIVRLTATKAANDGAIACIDSDFGVRDKAYRNLSAKEWSQVRSITVERHFAFNWLCGFSRGNNWDETPTGT